LPQLPAQPLTLPPALAPLGNYLPLELSRP
jgi:hypothetical protein